MCAAVLPRRSSVGTPSRSGSKSGRQSLGAGSGGGGDPPKKPTGKGRAPAQGKLSEAEKRNDELRKWAKLADEIINDIDGNAGRVKAPIRKKWLLDVLACLRVRRDFLQIRQRPNSDLLEKFINAGPNSNFRIVDNPPLREPQTYSFNPHGSPNYLLTTLAVSSKGMEEHEGDAACDSCKRGAGPFSGCFSMKDDDGNGLFYGACFNCGNGNNYDRCSNSLYSREDNQTLRSGAVPSSPARSDVSMGSAPASPRGGALSGGARSDVLNEVQHLYDFRQPVQAQSGSQRGAALIRFNYSVNATYDEMVASLQAALRVAADDTWASLADAQKSRKRF